MLQFLRKYQRFFFLIITVVIVMSFSFFGTWKAAATGDVVDPVAFEAVDGSRVTRSQLEEFVYFIGTDAVDAFSQGSGWGGNILNDGVLREDILGSGIAEVLATNYFDALQQDLSGRFDREKHFKPYVHPQASFISAQAAWSHFVPELNGAFSNFMSCDHKTPEGVKARIGLYLAEKKFPAGALRQVLHYQQQQHDFVTQDQRIYQEDLSLFGHHSLDDWFGHRFLQLSAQFIINVAKVAEQRGYVVTMEEAIADLSRNAEIAFQNSRQFNDVNVNSSGAYMDEMLRRLRMEEVRAAKVWRQVLLFRRLFNDVGGATLVDRLAYEKFSEYANEAVTVDMYQLPETLRFANARTLQKFEVYLDAVTGERRDPLSLPASLLSVSEVKGQTPEMVQRRYELSFTEADVNLLQTKVSVKETWQWEVDNFAKLQKQFPDLGVSKAKTVDERFEALDALDTATRTKVDAFARETITAEHPQWVDETLNESEPVETVVFIRNKGSIMPFKGISDAPSFMRSLEKGSLSKFSQDGQHYYNITVLEKGSADEVLSFEQANNDGTLDALLDAKLENHWLSIRNDSLQYRDGSGRYKPFATVKDNVADSLFSKLYRAVSDDFQEAAGVSTPLTSDGCAARRFFHYMRGVKEAMQKDSKVVSAFVSESNDRSLFDQWKLVKATRTIERSKADPAAFGQAFSLKEKGWSKVISPVHGDVAFFQVQGRGAMADGEAVSKKMDEARALLGKEAQQVLTLQLLAEIEQRGAIVVQADG